VDILWDDTYYQSSSQACLVDLTPPTFAGLASITANADGSLTASWLAATDATAPISYDVYISPGSVSAVTLFVDANVVSTVRNLSATVFTDATAAVLVAADTYTMGVRARDAVGNEDSNLVIDTEVVIYNLYQAVIAALLPVYESHAIVSIDGANNLICSLWLTGDNATVTTLLGTGAFTVYDKDDNAVVGMAQSGLTANPAGTFVSTPIPSSLLEPFTHYRIEITIIHNSITYTNSRGFTIGE
jgi:hypothetical protein